MATVRDVREIIREEPFMRRTILAAIGDGALTVPEIAAAIGQPTDEVMYWVMGMRKYGWLVEEKEVTDEGLYRYRVVPGRGR
jgi:predicted Rossmann fold nucleotide-binding protein DprA/Smf involved in DNA uptake